jgi:hypothetical protein
MLCYTYTARLVYYVLLVLILYLCEQTFAFYPIYSWPAIAQAGWFLAMGWAVWGSNRDFPQQSRLALGPTQTPVRWIPCPFPQPWVPPSLLYDGYRVRFLGEEVGACVD